MNRKKTMISIALAIVLYQTACSQATPVWGFQNGFSPRKGEYYLHNGNFINNHFHAGLSDRVETGIGVVSQTLEGLGLSLSLKIRFLQKEKFHWSAGAYGAKAWIGRADPQIYWNVYTAATWGTRLNYAGFSTGWLHNRYWGYYSGGTGILAPAAFVLSGGGPNTEIGFDLGENHAPFVGWHFRHSGKKTSAFMVECFYFPYPPGGHMFMLSPGIQIWRNPKRKFDLALTTVIGTLPNGRMYFQPLFVMNIHFGMGKATHVIWARDMGKLE